MSKDPCKFLDLKNQKKILSVFGESFGLVISLAFLFYIFPRLAFITPSYYVWFPIGLGTTIISSLLKIIKHIVNPNWLKKSMEFLSIIASLFSTYKLKTIFPFDFDKINVPNLNSIINTGLSFILVVLVITAIINFFQIFFPECKKPSKKK